VSLEVKEKTVHITLDTHKKMVDHLKMDGEGRDIGKFVDKASLEKIENEQKEKSNKK